jgi:thymidine phosphorylase
MLAQELIRIKRDGGDLPPEEIAGFVKGLTDGSVSEAQVAAMAMAVFL